MEALTVLSDTILPVFAIMAIGFILGRLAVFDAQDARRINRMAMSVLLPLLVFSQLAEAPVHEFRPVPILVYAGCELIVFAAGFWVARRLFDREVREAVLLAMCGVYANTAIYVLAISLLRYGDEGILPVSSVIMLDSTVAFGGAMVAMQLMEKGRVSVGTVLSAISRTPLLLALLLGILFAVVSVPIPRTLQTFLDFNGAAAAPVALFALGLVLSETVFRPDRVVLTFTLIKLAVFPAMVWLGLTALAGSGAQSEIFVLAAAGPSGAMALSLAVLHGVRSDAIAQVMVWTGVLTLFTLSALA